MTVTVTVTFKMSGYRVPHSIIRRRREGERKRRRVREGRRKSEETRKGGKERGRERDYK